MSVLLQISDPHFGTERAPVVAALTRLAERLVPDLVVLSGDITQRARRSQFAAARRFVNELAGACVMAIPGNHDIPLFNLIARCFYPYANFQRVFGPDLEPVFERPDLLVIAVNTTRPTRHKDGEVSTGQIRAVAERLLRASARQLRVVVTHQPVHVVSPQDVENLLHGCEAAVRAWAAAGADIVMGGHIHLPHVRPLRERFHDLPRSVWSVQAGTAVSARVRGRDPNSVNVLRCGASESAACEIERWDFSCSSGEFHAVLKESLRLDRAAAS